MTFSYFQKNIVILFVCVLLAGLFPGISFGAVLRPDLAKDTLSNATPGVSANHEIQFRVPQAVPPSGKIIITPETDALLIPLAFTVSDIDFAVAVSSSTAFAERVLSGAPSATEEGVVIQTGFSGSFTFILNSSEGLDVGNVVRIRLGTNTSYGENGVNQLVNSDTAGSYKILIQTRDGADVVIDSGGTMIAIIEPVSVGPVDTTDRTPPVLWGGLPTGLLPGGTKAVELSVHTDELATCRYSTTSGVAYLAMTGVFPTDTKIVAGDHLHYNAVARNLTDSTSYSFYVRCRDWRHNDNPDDYVISFNVGVVPIVGGTGSGSGTGGSGSGIGSGTGGGSGNYTGSGTRSPGGGGVGEPGGGNYLKTADITISGTAYPSSNIHILLDGKEKISVAAETGGKFSAKILGIERGTYTFGMYAVDAMGVRSSIISSTVSLIAGTMNTVSGILFPPTIAVEKNTVNPGEDLVFSGKSVPLSVIELYFGEPTEKFEGGAFSATGTADTSGTWRVTLKTDKTKIGNYSAQARSLLSLNEISGMSAKVPLGIGKEAAADVSLRTDLNKDGKVNLVDFSVLLFSWGTDDPVADINMNGKVDLQDFSIMIYYWTG